MVEVRTIITKNMYREALHIYLKHAYPDDDKQYYIKWAGLVPGNFWEGFYDDFPFPTEVRFGCFISVNTKLRCNINGFSFDTNHIGDPDNVVRKVKEIRILVENEWRQKGIPVRD